MENAGKCALLGRACARNRNFGYALYKVLMILLISSMHFFA